MKKFYGILLFAAVSLFACSNTAKAQQFDNSGFESWNALGTKPDSWNTLGYMGINLCDVTRSTDSHSGTYSAEIAPKKLSAMISTLLGVDRVLVPGMLTNATIDIENLVTVVNTIIPALSGDMDMSSMTMDSLLTLVNAFAGILQDGLPLNPADSIPTEVDGYYNFNNTGSDLFLAAAFLIKQDDAGNRTVVGAGVDIHEEDDETSDGFQPLSLPLMQWGTDPTELVFVAMTYNMDSTATNYGSVKLDDLSIQYQQVSAPSSLSEVNTDNSTFIYPNPSQDGMIRISCTKDSKVKVADALGRTVYSNDRYVSGTAITVPGNGIYFVSVDGKALKAIVK